MNDSESGLSHLYKPAENLCKFLNMLYWGRASIDISHDMILLNHMKTEIHPQYYTDAKVSCSCGNKFTVGSTQKEIHVEICSACHPFFTGNEKVIDAAGRVERFKARRAAATKTPSKKKASKS